MLKELKQQVYEANMKLVEYNLVSFTWGNVSGIDRSRGIIIIKPSGVPYSELKPEDMTVVDIDSSEIIEGKYLPSSDTATHQILYKSFSGIGGIVHTHSKWATIWAQSKRTIPALGTTHADYFYGDIPCTEDMSEDEIANDYEKNTGDIIVRTFNKINPIDMPGVLVGSHGPFTWGKDAEEAVFHAAVLEEIAMMAWYTINTERAPMRMNQELLDKHFFRKHGAGAYYGQKT